LAIESGQPPTTPLWLNAQRPSVNGATAVSTSGIPVVPFRSAASTAPDRIERASPGSDSSAQIGTLRRYRTSSRPAYQARPYPSAFTVPPWRMSHGAQDWRYSECGGSSTRSANVTGGPR
jgi:hypothetical protein